MESIKEQTDEQLVKLYISGNNQAFDILLDRYQSKLYSYILCSIQNPDLTNDLFQETFVKAIIHLRNGKYSESGKFYHWLTRIAHNLIVDQFRCEKNQHTLACDEIGYDFLNKLSMSEMQDSQTAGMEQTYRNVELLIENLPENQKTVIKMRFYQGLSFKEISAATGVSINTALGRMRYALFNMRRMATEQGLTLLS